MNPPGALQRQVMPTRREPTRDTRRAQAAVLIYAAVGVAAGIAGVAVALAGLGYFPPVVDPSPGYQSASPAALAYIASQVRVAEIQSSAILLGVDLVLIVGTLLRWRWLYYAVMVLGLPSILIAFTGLFHLLAPADSFVWPLWYEVLSVLPSLLSIALALWFIVLWGAHKQAWACRTVPATPAP